MKENYHVLVLTTPKDFIRVRKNYKRLLQYIPLEKLLFVGNDEVGELVKEQFEDERISFLNEEDIIPFAKVNDVMKKYLGIENVPRGITGWYYQQFLKMQYAYLCSEPYYMTWDGDTIPCRNFSIMTTESDIPYFDLKKEYHEEYFTTMGKLIPGLSKCVEESFISEHMLFRSDYMKELIGKIMEGAKEGILTFYEQIISVIPKEKLPQNSFSEFEIYGTYVATYHPEAYRLRRWHSFRHCGDFFNPDTISDEDYEWLGKDFDALSFEKGSSVREDNKEIFTKKEYREKLSARQILEIVQEEYLDGYKESWD